MIAGSNRTNRPHRMNIVDPITGDIVEYKKNEIDTKSNTTSKINSNINLNSRNQNFAKPDIRELSYIEQMYEEFDSLPVVKVNEILLRKDNKTESGINLLTLSTHNLGGQTIVIGKDELNREIKEYVNQDRGKVIMIENTNLEHLRNDLPISDYYAVTEFPKYNLPRRLSDICFYQEYQHQNITDYNNLKHVIENDVVFIERQNDLAFRIKGHTGDIVSENNAPRRDIKRFYRCPLKLNINDDGDELNIEIFNFHGGIFSNSTGLSQLKSNLNILSFIAYNPHPIIVAGDFNIDLLKKDYIIEHYDLSMNQSPGINDYLKEINFIERLENIIQEIHNNYIIYPNTQIKTNTWSLNHDINNIPNNLLLKKQEEINNKCIDYILIPKELAKYIIDDRVYVDSYIMATPELHQTVVDKTNVYTTMKNDFDHSMVILDLVFKSNLDCKLVPI